MILMYTGQYNHSIDSKGRLIVPSKFREELGNEFVVTKGLDGCLYMFDKLEWVKFQQKLTAMSDTMKKTRFLKRHFLGGASIVEVDKQGRTLLPITLRESAGITKDVIIIGVGEKIEIWAKEKLDAFEEADDAMSIEDIAEELGELGMEF